MLKTARLTEVTKAKLSKTIISIIMTIPEF